MWYRILCLQHITAKIFSRTDIPVSETQATSWRYSARVLLSTLLIIVRESGI